MTRRRVLLTTGVAFLAGISGLLIANVTWSPSHAVRLTPFRASGIYALGGQAGWTVTAEGSLAGTYPYSVKRNNGPPIRSGERDPASGKALVEVVENEPAMPFMAVAASGSKPQIFGAAIAPTKIKPAAERPADF